MATAANTVHKLQKTQYVGANNTMVHNSDVIVRGNLTIVGGQTYAQTSTLIVKDNIITLNAAIDQSGTPTLDAGIEIDRGSEQNVALLWKESEGAWKFTNDGVNYETLGGGSAGTYANSAFDKANAAFASANNVAPQVQPAFDKANAAYAFANSSSAWATRQSFVATAGQTVFPVDSGYLPGYVDVFYNGIKLYGGEDYIANNGNSVVLNSPATVNSIIEIVGLGANVPAANVYVLTTMTSFLNRQTFFANNGQTVFTPTQRYRVGYVDVYYNGLKLNIPEDVTANDGTDIVFVGLTPTTNDVIEIVGLTPNVALANAIPITGGTISGGLNLAGNVIPTTDNTYYLGSSTNRWHSLFVGPGSIDLGGLKLSNVGGVLSVSSPGSPAMPIAGEDTWARLQANLAYSSANNVAPQVQPAFNTANAAFLKANNALSYDANTSNTGFLAIPQGTTAQRPASAANGHIRYNTTLGVLETYFPTAGWVAVARDQYTVNYLLVAGGGGGGARIGAGGGAGGVLTGSTQVIPSTSYTITVGAGGTAGQPGPYQDPNSTRGGNGSFSLAFSLTAFGGGGGGGSDGGPGMAGGSGGGGARNITAPGGAGTPGQGYPGGSGSGSPDRSGGGGGAGGPGISGSISGNGGPGIINPVPSSTIGQLSAGAYYVAGGGGGSAYNGPTLGSGGLGGGGPAGPSTTGTPGTTNSGGGGGAGVYDGSNGYTGGAGGSGAVVIYYVSPVQRGGGGTVTSFTTGSTTYWIHTFTGSGIFTA